MFLPFFSLGMLEIGLIIGAIVLVANLVKRERRPVVHFSAAGNRPGPPRRGPSFRPPMPPPRPPRPPRPTVNVGHMIVSLMFFWAVLPIWALASLGDALAIPIHLLVAALTFFPALFATVIGAGSRKLWETTGQQLKLAARAFTNIIVRLLTWFGLGGLVDTFRPAPPPPPQFRPAQAPAPRRAPAHYPFEDRYRIESMLSAGGSTARLFVVRRVEGHRPVGDRLVLKYFDMGMGSRLEEVIRESRGMQVAKDMGIVLDHSLARDHFYYVMPYYEGETLTRAAARIHRHLQAGEGLIEADLRVTLGWMSQILRTLDGYHRHGVIHKDVKPDNMIVTEQGIRIVDLGLLTPLASALTLTTHGTEYFRDPEMVKLAVQGKRVKDVHAVRFDVYSAGAVMYLLLDGSFPACGPLSRISRPVPMVLSWITSRAMAEGEKRYPSIAAMRADLETAIRLGDEEGFENIPVSRLPSFAGFAPEVETPPPPAYEPPPPARAPEPMPRPVMPDPRPPRLTPVGAAPTPRRGSGLGAAIWICVALAVLFFGWLFYRTTGHLSGRGTPTPSVSVSPVSMNRVVENGPVLDAPALVSFLKTWRGATQRQLDRIPGGDIDDVPVLLVGDDTLVVTDILRETKALLAEEGIPFHPSSRLAETIRKLPGNAHAGEVQSKLLEELGTDTLPMVLRVTDLGYHDNARCFVVRGSYSGSHISRSFRGTAEDGR